MLPERILSVNDFQIADRGPRRFDQWIAKRSVTSSLGPFVVELYQPPDEELLRHANELVSLVSEQSDAILTVVL